MNLSAGGDDIAQQRFRAFDVDGEIVVDEKDRNLPEFAFRASLQHQQFVHNALVSAKPYGISEKSGDRAKLASVRASAPRFHRNDSERSPAVPEFPEHRSKSLRNDIKLFQVDRIPRNRRGFLLCRVFFFPSFIHGGGG